MKTSTKRFAMVLLVTACSAAAALPSIAQQNTRVNYDQYNTNTSQQNRPQIHPNFSQGANNQSYSGQGYTGQGNGGQGSYNQNYNNQGPNGQRYNGRVAYAPAGMNIPIRLSTGISTVVAQAGDPIQATVTKDIQLGGDCIPSGSTLTGQITDVQAAGRLGHSGHLGMKFTSIRTIDGDSYPINAHLVGGLDKYHQNGAEGSDEFKGENGWTKLKDVGVRGAVGTAGGAALGTAVGGIAGGGHGAGRGAWSGAAIGAGLGVADSLLVRKGHDINIKGGTAMEIQLDSPLSIAGNGRGTY